MTNVWANFQFNQADVDLNRIAAGFEKYDFKDNSYTNVHGTTYEDIYGASFSNNGNYFVDFFAGHGLVVNSQTGIPTAGTVNVINEWVYDGSNWQDAVGFEGFEVSALALQKAINSTSTDDDYKLINSILSGADVFDLSNYADNAFGLGGNDKFDGKGGNDSLDGGLGNDTIFGGSGADSLTGGRGADNLFGGFGNDVLLGNAGNDRLNGGAGADTLTGGDGADRFVFDQLKGFDHITDFSSAIDSIAFSKAVFKGLGAVGDLTSAAFYAAAGATNGHDADDRVIYNTTTGALYYDADGSGSAKAIQIAALDSHPTLAYTDVLIF